MKNKFELTTPVLYLVFNRPGYVKKTFPEIRKAKPMQLFIGADGPRNSEEKKKTDAVRKYILENIDWKCDVKTLFRKENLGCKHAVSGAINWFFKNVEQGIILEDDCLPDQSFFRFCQELLAKYENSKQVMQINGTNFSRSYFS
ncbi:nucleotide-diphospho-sugar transferase, partial [archaeon]|nr:nucleotide-diphospho-sugar transferase [archaeon]